MGDDMHQPRDGNGQFVSIATLFERERREHRKDHERESAVVREVAQRLEREVEQTATRLEKGVQVALNAVAETARIHSEAHVREHQAHERTHSVEKNQLDKAELVMSKRLDGMNEFRDALSDQAGRAVTRELFDATIKPLVEFRSRALGAAVVMAMLSGAVGAAIVKMLGG